MKPDEGEVRRMFEGLAKANVARYARMNLNDVFIGFCVARGMSPAEAMKFVQENPVQEDE